MARRKSEDGGSDSRVDDLKEAAKNAGIETPENDTPDTGGGDDPQPDAAASGNGRRPSRESYREQVEKSLQERYDSRFTATDQALNEIRSGLQQMFQQVSSFNKKPEPSPEDGIKDRLSQLDEQRKSIMLASRSDKLTPEERQKLADQYESITQQRMDLIIDAKVKAMKPKETPRRESSDMTPEQRVWNNRLWREYPELMEQVELDGDLATQVRSHYKRLCKQKNAGQDSPALLRQAAADYTRFLGLGQQRRSRSAAFETGGGSFGGDDDGVPSYGATALELMKRAGVTPEKVTEVGKQRAEESARRRRMM